MPLSQSFKKFLPSVSALRSRNDSRRLNVSSCAFLVLHSSLLWHVKRKQVLFIRTATSQLPLLQHNSWHVSMLTTAPWFEKFPAFNPPTNAVWLNVGPKMHSCLLAAVVCLGRAFGAVGVWDNSNFNSFKSTRLCGFWGFLLSVVFGMVVVGASRVIGTKKNVNHILRSHDESCPGLAYLILRSPRKASV